jgi:hypothetical protein
MRPIEEERSQRCCAAKYFLPTHRHAPIAIHPGKVSCGNRLAAGKQEENVVLDLSGLETDCRLEARGTETGDEDLKTLVSPLVLSARGLTLSITK